MTFRNSIRRHWCLLPLIICQAYTQTPNPSPSKSQIAGIHTLEKSGAGALPDLAKFLQNPDRNVRVEAVKAIVKIGSTQSLDPLVMATRDADPEVRIRATEGIVNVYQPGFLTDNSLSGLFTHGVRQIKSFFSSRNDSVIDDDVTVRDDVSQAISQEINFGGEMPPRSDAALAAGILKLKGAVPDLLRALHSNDSDLIFESLVALQKIHDPSAGAGVGFLVRDLDERTQITALQTVGVLRSTEAAHDVRYAIENARNLKVKRAALGALAMLALPEDRTVFRQFVINGDPGLRAAALEGLGRVREPEDTPTIQASFDEANADWRIHLAAAFALVNEGTVSTEEFSPLQYLVENLNSRQRADVADAYLKELIHREEVRKNIVTTLDEATTAQKLALCWIFAASRSADLLPTLNQLARDNDAGVEIAAKRAQHVIATGQTP
jgi:HEAT repeat protein